MTSQCLCQVGLSTCTDSMQIEQHMFAATFLPRQHVFMELMPKEALPALHML